MGGFVLTNAVRNGRGTPSMNTNTLVNRPAAGTVGRIFIDTTNNRIQRDTGSTWVNLVGGAASNVANRYIPRSNGSDFTQSSIYENDTGNVIVGGASDNGSKFQVIGSTHVTGQITQTGEQLIIGNGLLGQHYVNFRTNVNDSGYVHYDGNIMKIWANNIIRATFGGATYTGQDIVGNSRNQGSMEVTTTIKTGNPTGYTAHTWRLGEKRTVVSSAIKATVAIPVEINGELVWLAVADVALS